MFLITISLIKQLNFKKNNLLPGIKASKFGVLVQNQNLRSYEVAKSYQQYRTNLTFSFCLFVEFEQEKCRTLFSIEYLFKKILDPLYIPLISEQSLYEGVTMAINYTELQ